MMTANHFWRLCLFHRLRLLLLLSHFSRVRLCVTPKTAAHQAPLSLGFSRQEYWSGLPFPSPVHESEKWKAKSLSRVRLLATPWTAAHQAPPFMGFSRQEYWSGVPLPSPLSQTISSQMPKSPSYTLLPFLPTFRPLLSLISVLPWPPAGSSSLYAFFTGTTLCTGTKVIYLLKQTLNPCHIQVMFFCDFLSSKVIFLHGI